MQEYIKYKKLTLIDTNYAASSYLYINDIVSFYIHKKFIHYKFTFITRFYKNPANQRTVKFNSSMELYVPLCVYS